MLSVRKVTQKAGEGTQYAALCFRAHKGKSHQILLVTSRGTGRWIPPKGWPIKGLTPAQTAEREALEEAGVRGQVFEAALGCYKYHRVPGTHAKLSAEAYIFPLLVGGRMRDFKEKGQRKVQWFSPKKAAMLVREPKLKKIIRAFDPAALPPI